MTPASAARRPFACGFSTSGCALPSFTLLYVWIASCGRRQPPGGFVVSPCPSSRLPGRSRARLGVLALLSSFSQTITNIHLVSRGRWRERIGRQILARFVCLLSAFCRRAGLRVLSAYGYRSRSIPSAAAPFCTPDDASSNADVPISRVVEERHEGLS